MPPPKAPNSRYFRIGKKKSKLKFPETAMFPAFLASIRPFMFLCHRRILLSGYRHFARTYQANTRKNFGKIITS